MAEVFRAKNQSDGKWNALNQGHDNETSRGVLAADGRDIIQASEGNPVVNPKKSDLKSLQCKQ
jgi:hypothetical protein